MIDVVFERVSKRYRVRSPGPAWGGLRRRARGVDFWALDNVSFDVARGETLGIVGNNGAGKSTVLKLLSGITAPTRGRITISGRVAALIEVGSGFHPELTGRENVFLSGTILGMRRREIGTKLDAIVEFAGVAPFLDTPVKWYSSGMYVRLGFAVAAHLDPDVLLIDEVLAVGDVEFQAKCLSRVEDMRRDGTTVIVISHDLHAVERLAGRALLLEQGRVAASGAPADVLAVYRNRLADAQPRRHADVREDTLGSVEISRVTFADAHGAPCVRFTTGSGCRTRVDYVAAAPAADVLFELFYYSHAGRVLECQQTTALAGEPLDLVPGPGAIEFVWPELPLQPGVYAVGATARTRDGARTLGWWYADDAIAVTTGKMVRGGFYAPHSWQRMEMAGAAPVA
jgi:ABC-type polysaccharide/polyol phosphate transport system ATPase subunit